MKLYTIKDDGTEWKTITDNNGTNWAPFPAPDGIHYVYVKVLPGILPNGQPGGRPNFEVFLGNFLTGEQTRLTYSPGFDGFPVLSPDGNTLTFSSDRDVTPVKGGPKKLYIYFMDVSSLKLGKK
jgi:TolB protein